MKGISRFFTLYWIIYFPTCIAYNDLPGFSSIDEIMMGILFVYTFMKYSNRSINRRPWREFMVCLSVIAFIFFVKKKLNFQSTKTILFACILVIVVLAVTWTRFDAYYVSGLSNDNLARPMTYKTSLVILGDYFPFGPGMGTFACNGAWKYYSPLYYEYNLNQVWGLGEGGGFICDAYYPTLAQFGIVGVFFFCWFWKRKIGRAHV